MANQILEEDKSLFGKANALASSNKIAPVTGTFDEANGVEGRVNRITNSDSPLMQTAATKAAQASNARGLNNSSLGIQAGQQAVIETATPIAQADANLFQGQSLANQSAQNNAATANASNAINAGVQGMGMDNTAEIQGKSLMESARQFDTGQANQSAQFSQNLALQTKQLDTQIAQFAQNLGLTEQELQLKKDQLSASDRQALATLELQKTKLTQDATLAQLDADTKTKIATMDAEWRAKLGGDQNLTNSWGTMMQNIGNIQNNSALNEGAKKTLIQNTIDSFQAYASFYTKTTGIDVGSLLDFGIAATPGAVELQQEAIREQDAKTPREESTGGL